jgi:PhnB protein
MPIPKNYQQVMPYLVLPQADRFASFMQEVFDTKETLRMMRNKECIQHAEIMIGDCTIMFADSTETYPPRPGGMFVYVDDADKRYEKAIQAGAQSLASPSDQPYGRSAGIQDRFGNSWWITSIPKV